ncbi:MAG: hypothetical protein IPM39_09695 [Chloroflexi bacterium]|nr:hypothetical protein [Chloroflexota bacterium]
MLTDFEKSSRLRPIAQGNSSPSAKETTPNGSLKRYLALFSPTLLKFFEPKLGFGLFVLPFWGKQLPESKVIHLWVYANYSPGSSTIPDGCGAIVFVWYNKGSGELSSVLWAFNQISFHVMI